MKKTNTDRTEAKDCKTKNLFSGTQFLETFSHIFKLFRIKTFAFSCLQPELEWLENNTGQIVSCVFHSCKNMSTYQVAKHSWSPCLQEPNDSFLKDFSRRIKCQGLQITCSLPVWEVSLLCTSYSFKFLHWRESGS